MKLLDHMRLCEIDDDAFAAMIGGCSGHAVKKWKYGEREPDAVTIQKIELATKGAVTIADWAEQSLARAVAKQSPSEPVRASV